MGMYTGLRFKGIIKESFREDFENIALTGEWENAKDEKIRNFSNVSRASFIPCGALCYMPDSWEDENNNATDGFNTTYDSKTGYWTFQCSLKNYDSTYEEFLKLIPYFIENIEHCETFYEEYTYSEKYDLVDGEMKITNYKFNKYGYDD